jgi:gluconokinase
VLFLHLEGSMDTLAARMAARSHEFMPATLLTSQLEALEPLDSDEWHVLLDVRHSPAELADKACVALEAMPTPVGEKATPAASRD